MSAISWSSTPMIETSSGTRWPRLRSVRSPPYAISSNSANTAVGGLPALNSSAIAAEPPARPNGPDTSRAGSGVMPGLEQGEPVPVAAFGRVAERDRFVTAVAQQGDAFVTEIDQVLGGPRGG